MDAKLNENFEYFAQKIEVAKDALMILDHLDFKYVKMKTSVDIKILELLSNKLNLPIIEAIPLSDSNSHIPLNDSNVQMITIPCGDNGIIIYGVIPDIILPFDVNHEFQSNGTETLEEENHRINNPII